MALLADHKQTDQITDEELVTLRQLLKLLRHDSQWVPDFIDGLCIRADALSAGSTLDALIQAWVKEPENRSPRHGVLHYLGTGGGHVEVDESEFKRLRDYLAVIRSHSWLSGHIAQECEWFARGERLTPEEVMRHLIGAEVAEFDAQMDVTRTMLRDYPRLLQDEITAATQASGEPQRSPTNPVPDTMRSRPPGATS